MAFLAIEIDTDTLSIADFNQRVLNGGATKADVVMNALINLCASIQSGRTPGTVQLTSKDVTSSITTSGSGSTQIDLNLA